jgi:hypothetical protein
MILKSLQEIKLTIKKERIMNAKEKFMAMIKPYPFAIKFVSETGSLDSKAIKEFLTVCSSEEEILLQFFCTVWSKENSFGFNILDAGSLGDKDRNVIATWLNDPFWP